LPKLVGVVAVVAIFAWCLFTYLQHPPETTSSSVEVTAASNPVPAPAPAARTAKVEVQDYEAKMIDADHFAIHYVILNTGNAAARQVEITLFPWQGGSVRYSDETPLAANHYAQRITQVDRIPLLRAGEKLTRSLEVAELPDASPALAYPKIEIHFVTDPSVQ